MGDKILKIYGDNIMLNDEVYVGTSGLWMLITDKCPKTYTKEDDESYCMKPMLCIVTMTLKVVILELTDQRNGRKFCDQYGKSPSRKELYTVMTMKYISVVTDCIYRKMDAASIFEELVPGYISDHVLC